MGRRHAYRACYLLTAALLACDSADPVAPSFMTVNPPGGLSATAAAYNQINLSWQDNSSNETGFEVYRSSNGPSGSFTLLATIGPSSRSYGDFGLVSSTQYCYEVRSFRTTGRKNTYSSFSNVACATTLPLPAPAAPSATSAVPSYSSVIHVTWVDNSSDETGFRAEFSLDGGTSWQDVRYPLYQNSTQFDHGGRTPDQAVCYRIIALGSLANSAPSNVDCTAPPLAPDQLQATGVAGAIDLSWQDNSLVEDGYEVRRADPSGQSVVVGSLPADTKAFHDASVTSDTRYTYSVAAKKDGGFSNFVSINAISVSVPPSTPVITGAFPQSSSGIALYWTEDSQNQDGFRIEYSADEGGSWSTVGSVLWNERSFGHYGLAGDQRACYRVVAFNAAGESPSDMACATPPAAPTDLVAQTATASGAIDLSWTDNSNQEEGYQIWEVFSNNCYYYYYCYPYTYYNTVATVGANATSFQVTGLNPGEFHTYVVVALKDGGTSDLSNEAGAYAGSSGP